jgi:hypothetical protein
MPRYHIENVQKGVRLTTIEIMASTKEEAKEMVAKGKIISEEFHSFEHGVVSIEEIEDPQQKLRDYLLAKGWEMPMSEEDGCETWRFPFERRNEWPPGVGCRTQHYWDLEEAVELQMLVDRFH